MQSEENEIKIKKRLTDNERAFFEALKMEMKVASDHYQTIAHNAEYESDDITLNYVNQASAYKNISLYVDSTVEKLLNQNRNDALLVNDNEANLNKLSDIIVEKLCKKLMELPAFSVFCEQGPDIVGMAAKTETQENATEQRPFD